ncbi:MAG: flavin reductase family protein [Phyllobacteriaceae bacterium]|jgi:flavin reductase (DIM6/NTAB) family NADH-FMN oxidoreductase RutF|nr:flavin reductase family protein [Phyllobacteriaceae bacterium]
MNYDPRQSGRPLPFDPFKSLTVPRPVGWISTISTDGRANLAPFSQWQNITYDPPIVMFSADQHVDGRKKDTVINAEATGYFVWNMSTFALREAVNITAKPFPFGTDEFEAAGLTKAPCVEAPGPRVAESPCHMECKYLTTLRFPGTTKVSDADVVFGRVVRIHVNDDVILPSGKLDILKIRPLARLGYYDYTSVTETFEMRIPGASAAEMAGLEGRQR